MEISLFFDHEPPAFPPKDKLVPEMLYPGEGDPFSVMGTGDRANPVPWVKWGKNT